MLDPLLGDWLNLFFRWMHVILGIAWIGHSFFFMWMDANLEKSDRDGVEGHLWMVHSGGFYRVEKQRVIPEETPRALHWFKWEAAFTWVTGFVLLLVVYHLGGAMVALGSGQEAGQASLIGLGLLPVAWLVYDGLWQSPLGRRELLAGTLTIALVVWVTWALPAFMSGRAAWIHVGAMLGTLMAVNVWARILPAQRSLVKSMHDGSAADPQLGVRAKQRSVHNNLMTFPLIAIMISNHFPALYGHEQAWLILVGLGLVGLGLRKHMHSDGPVSWGALAGAVALLAFMAHLLRPEPMEEFDRGDSPVSVAVPGADVEASGAASVSEPVREPGAIRGNVRFEGTPPAPRQVVMQADCAMRHEGPVRDESLVVSEGGVANVFVAVVEGLAQGSRSPVPDTPVVVDQEGCLYTPRVVGVAVGQSLVLQNSDPFLHNVRAVAEDNRGFNLSMPMEGMRLERRFRKPERMVQLRCDVHPWMGAWIGVMEHSFYAISDAVGAYVISDLPPGDYVLEAWHEVLGTKRFEVRVNEGSVVTSDLVWQLGQ